MTVATPAVAAAPVRRKRTRRRVLTIFGGALGALVGLAVLGIVVAKPGTVNPPCRPDKPCGTPPSRAPRLVVGTIWHSTLGFEMEYYTRILKVMKKDDRNLALRLEIPSRPELDLFLWVTVAPSTEATPLQLAEDRLSFFRGNTLGFKSDPNSKHELLSPLVGDVHGIGGSYAGTIDSPQGPGQSLEVLLAAATDGRQSAVVSVATSMPEQSSGDSPYPIFSLADTLMNTFRWPGEPLPR